MHLQEIFELIRITWSFALYIMSPMYLQSLKLLQSMVKGTHLKGNTLFDKGPRPHEILPMYPRYHVTYALLLRPMVKEKIHIHENTLFDLDHVVIIWPWTWGQCHTKCCPAPSTSCDLCTYRVWSNLVQRFRRRCIYKNIHYLTRNVAQYPLHHMTYSAAKSEFATSNILGGDRFTRKCIIWPLTFTLESMSHEKLPSTLHIMWPIQQQSVKLLRLTGQCHTKCFPVPSTSCDLFSYKVCSCYA